MAGVDHFLVYMQTTIKSTFSIYTTPGARSAPGVVYIQIATFYSGFHIHQEMVYTSHFLIFSGPKPGGGNHARNI